MGEDGEEIAEEGGGGKGKLIILIGVVVLLLLIGGGGAAAYFLGFLDPLLGIEEDVQMEEEPLLDEEGDPVLDDEGNVVMVPVENPEPVDDGLPPELPPAVDENGNPLGPAYLDMREFLIDWEAGGKRLAYLKLTVSLELVSDNDVAAVTAVVDGLHDELTGWLREQRPDDMTGSEGMFRLREEILIRANRAADPVPIRDVVIKNILVQ